MVCRESIFQEEKLDRHRKINREDVSRAEKAWNVNKEVVNIKSIRFSKKEDSAYLDKNSINKTKEMQDRLHE